MTGLKKNNLSLNIALIMLSSLHFQSCSASPSEPLHAGIPRDNISESDSDFLSDFNTDSISRESVVIFDSFEDLPPDFQRRVLLSRRLIDSTNTQTYRKNKGSLRNPMKDKLCLRDIDDDS